MSKVLFIAKNTNWCDQAEEYTKQVFSNDVLVVKGNTGDVLPNIVREWSGEILLSFLSPWIIPASVLEKASVQAINFHPGPPEYPGIGCYNFALYHEVTQYGITAHEMAPKVDTGSILAVKSFPVDASESVWSLKEKSMVAMLELFKEIVAKLSKGRVSQDSSLTWKRRPYTRQELNDLCCLSVSMDQKEIDRRIRATTFPGAPGAYYPKAL